MGGLWTKKRAVGVAMHISCLPSAQGIGCFDKNAYQFVDFLCAAGMKFWQVCPLTPTGYGDSPYQGLSSWAINPYFIDLKALEISIPDLPNDECRVAFGAIYHFFQDALSKIRENFPQNEREKLRYFRAHTPWLRPYALFSALKKHFEGKSWMEWPPPYRQYAKIDVTKLAPSILEDGESYEILQYLAYQQWQKLKGYAHEKGVQIIGDIPMYPGLDSADVWSEPKNFQLDENLKPLRIAGVPPDYFSEDGQLWGNPVYDWSYLERTNYDWWRRRIEYHREIFDVLRLDHFRGFDRFWSVPQNALTAKNGKWERGPGEKLFRHFKNIPLIAEDLGELDASVHRLMEQLSCPGMKVMQFAFSHDAKNSYLPHHHHPFAVLYIGTHDNDTLLGWYRHCDESTKDQIHRYFGIDDHEVLWKFLTEIYRSPCFLGIISVQDLLGLDSEGRLNIPGTECHNWQWRMTSGQFAALEAMASTLKAYVLQYDR
ncbi:MAG: 4-alpha-glucanotransferase [Puniceicoccales bacterium]|nr:4-alpha-glucanotransferase [Puniceicoccales bacterium]